ncbi:hypothetical protein NS365_15215 [Aureimonas ureilytica]|uniref:Uncharacterized protein n=1 Tax=Aureimonas ureilytica TaxID=401562 RepID=A0A175RM52_9HYPH|nr:hypothetical protein NS365_15215 [Aureimonas ureilytica]
MRLGMDKPSRRFFRSSLRAGDRTLRQRAGEGLAFPTRRRAQTMQRIGNDDRGRKDPADRPAGFWPRL